MTVQLFNRLIVFSRHYRGQEDMAEAVNGLAGKVVPGEIEFESALETLDAAG